MKAWRNLKFLVLNHYWNKTISTSFEDHKLPNYLFNFKSKNDLYSNLLSFYLRMSRKEQGINLDKRMKNYLTH